MDPFGVKHEISTMVDANNGSDETIHDRARMAMGDTLAYASKLNLGSINPRSDLASSGYCLADPGATVLGIFALVSQAGIPQEPFIPTDATFIVEWFDPYTGQTAAAGTVVGGASRILTSPFMGDAVLYLTSVENGATLSTQPSAPGNISFHSLVCL